MASLKKGDDFVAVGMVAGAHGIRGEVRVESLTDFPERFDAGSELLLVSSRGETREVKILQSRLHKNRYLIVLEGVADRSAAESLRGSYLKIPEEELKKLPEGKYYHHQLTGLSVVTEEGEPLGSVTGIIPTGGNLVLEVRDGGREVLIPFVDEVVREVDLGNGKIIVHLMPGLLPDA